MGLDSVLVIADQVDENLAWRRATWPTCWSSSRATPIPVAGLLKKVLVTKARSSSSRRCSHEPRRQKFDEGRLAQVLVAPIVSEKATIAAEKNNQVLFRCCATRPSPRSRRPSS